MRGKILDMDSLPQGMPYLELEVYIDLSRSIKDCLLHRDEVLRDGHAQAVYGKALKAMRPEEEPRELKITKRLLVKFGYSDGCPGCRWQRVGHSTRRMHTDR